MPELRKDPITGRWVIISTERGRRPFAYSKVVEERKGGFCPFCEGNEKHTPPEILAYRNGGERDSPGWSLRIVPNKYPALQIEGELSPEGEGMFDKMNGIGAHEVIIESPKHDATLANMPEKELETMFWAFRDRILDLRRDKRLRYVLLFKNQGEAAGSTMEHSHSQLIALPIVPKQALEEISGAKAYFNYKERCVFCDVIRQEKDEGIRVIEENTGFIALAPFAPRYPFETWILPKTHGASFENCQKKDYEQLAKILKIFLSKMDKALENPPYNMIIHSTPFFEDADDYYHWHIEITPKLSRVAGFEGGTGFYINPTSPEEAAASLRDTTLGS